MQVKRKGTASRRRGCRRTGAENWKKVSEAQRAGARARDLFAQGCP
jgi:hypothetical protein